LLVTSIVITKLSNNKNKETNYKHNKIEEISDYFIHKNIKKVIGKPTREDITQILDKTHEDSAAVPCELRGCLHGHLGMTMSDVECASVTAETFEAHTNPELLPTMATDATRHQIAAAKELYKKKINLFKE